MSNTNTTDLLINIALITAPFIGGLLVIYVRSWLIAHKYRTEYFDMIVQGGGAAYAYLAKNNMRITNSTAVIAALQYGLDVVLQSPDFNKKMESVGVNETYTKKLINAELGKLAASDPSVTVGASDPAPNVAVAVTTDETKSEGAPTAQNIEAAVINSLKDHA